MKLEMTPLIWKDVFHISDVAGISFGDYGSDRTQAGLNDWGIKLDIKKPISHEFTCINLFLKKDFKLTAAIQSWSSLSPIVRDLFAGNTEVGTISQEHANQIGIESLWNSIKKENQFMHPPVQIDITNKNLSFSQYYVYSGEFGDIFKIGAYDIVDKNGKIIVQQDPRPVYIHNGTQLLNPGKLIRMSPEQIKFIFELQKNHVFKQKENDNLLMETLRAKLK